MNKRNFYAKVILPAIVLLFGLGYAHVASPANSAVLSTPRDSQPLAAVVSGPQQYPLMDMIVDKIIQKYQTSTCEQLWQEKAQPKKKPSAQEQEMITLLRNDPQMRAAFISKIAPPIANKMFDCGMIP